MCTLNPQRTNKYQYVRYDTSYMHRTWCEYAYAPNCGDEYFKRTQFDILGFCMQKFESLGFCTKKGNVSDSHTNAPHPANENRTGPHPRHTHTRAPATVTATRLARDQDRQTNKQTKEQRRAVGPVPGLSPHRARGPLLVFYPPPPPVSRVCVESGERHATRALRLLYIV